MCPVIPEPGLGTGVRWGQGRHMATGCARGRARGGWGWGRGQWARKRGWLDVNRLPYLAETEVHAPRLVITVGKAVCGDMLRPLRSVARLVL